MKKKKKRHSRRSLALVAEVGETRRQPDLVEL